MPFEIITGGQSGVDRAALDLALERGVPCSGWCPAGGWAEDFPDPPGLLARYPMLKPTPLADPAQRTEWNVRDSDALLIILDAKGAEASQGTQLAAWLAAQKGRPCMLVSLDDADAVERAAVWLQDVRPRRLGIGGPRESEAPGIYDATRRFLEQVLERI